MTDHLLTECDVAIRLSVSVIKINRMIREDSIPYLTLPCGAIRFDDDDLSAWSDSLKHPPLTTIVGA